MIRLMKYESALLYLIAALFWYNVQINDETRTTNNSDS